MPLYEYRCDVCGTEFERYVATTSTAVRCSSCASEGVTRKISIVRTRGNNAYPPFAVPTAGCRGGCERGH